MSQLGFFDAEWEREAELERLAELRAAQVRAARAKTKRDADIRAAFVAKREARRRRVPFAGSVYLVVRAWYLAHGWSALENDAEHQSGEHQTHDRGQPDAARRILAKDRGRASAQLIEEGWKRRIVFDGGERIRQVLALGVQFGAVGRLWRVTRYPTEPLGNDPRQSEGLRDPAELPRPSRRLRRRNNHVVVGLASGAPALNPLVVEAACARRQIVSELIPPSPDHEHVYLRSKSYNILRGPLEVRYRTAAELAELAEIEAVVDQELARELEEPE